MKWILKHIDTINSICIWTALVSSLASAILIPEERLPWLAVVCWTFIAKVNSHTIVGYEKLANCLMKDNLRLCAENLKLSKEKIEQLKGKTDEQCT